MVRISFPDGSTREYEAAVTGMAIAESISQRLAKEALSVTVDGVVWDLTRPIEQDATVKINTPTGILRRTLWRKPLKISSLACGLV